MSVGHVARLLEQAGIPTVIIAVKAFVNRMKMMTLPRVLLTPHIMGRPLGRPKDRDRHLAVLKESLDLLERAYDRGTIREMPL